MLLFQKLIFKNSIKYNLLSFDELVINLDRLSRFKLPEESFTRVFGYIILKKLITPKYSKNDFLNEDARVIAKFVKEIWNESVKACCDTTFNNSNANIALKSIIKDTFNVK